jgi:hypothetical protein
MHLSLPEGFARFSIVFSDKLNISPRKLLFVVLELTQSASLSIREQIDVEEHLDISP